MPTPAFAFSTGEALSTVDMTTGGQKNHYELLQAVIPYVNNMADSFAEMQAELNWFMSKLSSVNAIEFGGYYITKTQLASRNGLVGLSSAKTDVNDIRIWAGAQKDEIPPFRVYENGLMVASNQTT